MDFNTRKYAGAVQEAIDFVGQLTPSVIAIARASGVSAKKFAEALNESEANSLYRIELSSVLQKMLVDSAVAEEKKRAKAE